MKPASEISDLPDGFAVATAAMDADVRTVAAPTEPSRVNDFYELTKPRMNFLIVITTMVGYFMASRGDANWTRLLHTLLGTALTASGAGVLNQLIEREYDKLMPRTRNRPLPAGRVAPAEAVCYGVALGVAGVTYLAILVNALTASLGALTLLSYLFIYTPMKRRTTLNTVIGAVPGAIPPVMGWTAVHNVIQPEAIALFAILFFWQMPHFLAIAILYRNDYKAGGFKMLPVVDEDLIITGRQIVLYAVALVPVTLMPTVIGMAGSAYFTAAMLLGLAFLSFAISCAATRTRSDARKLFFASIIYLPLLLAVMMLNKM
ncbi:MAG TPA: heme o synthase [Tepidisphaeraceae bacterium]|nr:heme o synthase [Tepidisphaeraceae bacterium]